MTLRPVLKALGVIAVVALLAGATSARAELREVTHVSEGIIAAAIAYEIGHKCGPVDARLLRGISFLNGLKTHAASLGYSGAEIDAFIDDKAEQDRLEAIARERLRGMGALEGQSETYCTVGRAEIAAGSQIGQLLR